MQQTHTGKSTPHELANYSTPINSHVDDTYNNPINSLAEDNDYEEIPGYKNNDLVEYVEVPTMKLEDMEDKEDGHLSGEFEGFKIWNFSNFLFKVYAVPMTKSERQQNADFNA